MICAACKAEIDDNSRFCPRCGAAKPDKFSSGLNDTYYANSPGGASDNEQFSNEDRDKQSRFDESADKPFFVQTSGEESKEANTYKQMENSGSPYAQGYRPRQPGTSSWYAQNKSATSNAESTGKARSTYNTNSAHNNSSNAQNRYNNQQAYTAPNADQSSYDGFPFQPRRTFDDKSVRKFLVGFTIVAVAVVAIVVTLVIYSGALLLLR